MSSCLFGMPEESNKFLNSSGLSSSSNSFSGLMPKSFTKEFDITPIKATNGSKIFNKGFKRKEAGKAILSGLRAAIVFGVTSANIRIMSVKTIVT